MFQLTFCSSGSNLGILCDLRSSDLDESCLLLFFLFSFLLSCFDFVCSLAWTSFKRSPQREDSNNSLPFWIVLVIFSLISGEPVFFGITVCGTEGGGGVCARVLPVRVFECPGSGCMGSCDPHFTKEWPPGPPWRLVLPRQPGIFWPRLGAVPWIFVK